MALYTALFKALYRARALIPYYLLLFPTPIPCSFFVNPFPLCQPIAALSTQFRKPGASTCGIGWGGYATRFLNEGNIGLKTEPYTGPSMGPYIYIWPYIRHSFKLFVGEGSLNFPKGPNKWLYRTPTQNLSTLLSRPERS